VLAIRHDMEGVGAAPANGRRFEECRFWDGGPLQCAQCLLSGEMVVLSGGPGARGEEQFDLVAHEGLPLLVGRQGTDETRTLMFADDLFGYRVESENRPGFESPQRLLKSRGDALTDSAISQHGSFVEDITVTTVPFQSKVLRYDILSPAGEREQVHLEWYMSHAAVGDKPAITVWCNLLACFNYIFKDVPKEMRKGRYRNWSTGSVAQNAFNRWEVPLHELLLSKKSREAMGRKTAGRPMQDDLGPTEACTSAAGLCILLLWSAQSEKADDDAETPLKLRCVALLRELCAKFLGEITWRVALPNRECTLQVDRGNVNLDVLAETHWGRDICERTDW
jgi:hypothetical protein